jgi:hypothetical protein
MKIDDPTAEAASGLAAEFLTLMSGRNGDVCLLASMSIFVFLAPSGVGKRETVVVSL